MHPALYSAFADEFEKIAKEKDEWQKNPWQSQGRGGRQRTPEYQKYLKRKSYGKTVGTLAGGLGLGGLGLYGGTKVVRNLRLRHPAAQLASLLPLGVLGANIGVRLGRAASKRIVGAAPKRKFVDQD